MTDRERIEYLMNTYKLTPSQFADKTGIQRASVSHILADRNKPSLEVFLKIHRAFPDIALNWLVADEGEPPAAVEETAVAEEMDAASVGIREDNKDNQEESMQQQQCVATTLFPSFMEELPLPSQNTAGSASNRERQKSESKSKESLYTPAVGDTSVKQEERRENGVPFSDAPSADETLSLKMASDSNKRIREIKIFYDNGTYETFVREK